MSGHGPVFHAGEFRDCGFSGVDDGRYFPDKVERPREYTYDDPDYKPGHGASPTIIVDFGAMAVSHGFNLGLHGPEVPPDFVRKPNQRTDYYGTTVIENRHWLKGLFDSVGQEAVEKVTEQVEHTAPINKSPTTDSKEKSPETNRYARALELDRIARNTERFIASQPDTPPAQQPPATQPDHGYEIHVDLATGEWNVRDF